MIWFGALLYSSLVALKLCLSDLFYNSQMLQIDIQAKYNLALWQLM